MVELFGLAISLLSATATFIAGRKKWYAWVVALSTLPLWVFFIYLTGSWTLLISVLVSGSVYVINLRKWRRET
jgi:hypothetical protein